MEILLNRWRGTGVIFYNIKGVHIYALYLGLLVWFLSNYLYGLIARIGTVVQQQAKLIEELRLEVEILKRAK